MIRELTENLLHHLGYDADFAEKARQPLTSTRLPLIHQPLMMR